MASEMASEPSDRAREIVSVARQLLEQEGLEGLSMRRIADRLGIRAPSIYKHLPDKQALENALISQGFEEAAAALEEARANASGDPAVALGWAYRTFALEHPHLYRLMTDRELDRANLAPGVEDAAARPLLEALAGDGDLARAAFGFVHGMTILELNHRFPEGADLDAAWRSGLRAFARAQS